MVNTDPRRIPAPGHYIAVSACGGSALQIVSALLSRTLPQSISVLRSIAELASRTNHSDHSLRQSNPIEQR